jgi:hypothetical protein
MDALLLIFALQLVVLFLCLTFSVEGSKLRSTFSLQTLKSLLARLVGSKHSTELDVCENDPPKFDVDAHSSNDKGVVYLDSNRSRNCLADFSDEDELDSLESDSGKSNFNVLPVPVHSHFILTHVLGFARQTVKFLKAFALRFRKSRNGQKRLQMFIGHHTATGAASSQQKASSAHRNVSHLASLSSQVMSSRVKSGQLRYVNKELSESVSTHLKTKLTKLNFVIYKKKKTRPLAVIYELPEEMF